ncbi:MAG: hypothetical protein ACREEM_16370 [Blastocatellia bacterium]
MATTSNRSLLVENLNATTVRVTVRYRLTPNAIEKLAGTVFSENIQLIGDDPGVVNDIVITNFPGDAFAVNAGTTFVDRTRTRNVLKSAMNEDPEFLTTGAEVIDETFARITLAYAANPPIPPALPGPASTNIVTGAWK